MPVKKEGLSLEYLPLNLIKRWPRNPKRHSMQLSKAFEKFGFLIPLIVDETTGQLVAGHGRIEHLENMQKLGKRAPQGIRTSGQEWLVPIVRGVYFDSTEQAEEFLLSDNLLQMAGGWDVPALDEMISELDEVIGAIESVGEKIKPLEPEVREVEDRIQEMSKMAKSPIEADDEVTNSKEEKKLSDQQKYDQLEHRLDGVKQLSMDAYFLPSDDDFTGQCIKSCFNGASQLGVNQWDIPNLRPDMLVEKLPEPLQIWGDRKVTPDDGKSWFLHNYGVSPFEGLPFERVIESWFSWDRNIESWWTTTAYRVGQMINNGTKMAIVPDYSIWDFAPSVLQIYSVYRANWLGRYFQETGQIRVIPRLEYFVDKAKPFSLAGIPYEAPVIATQMQTGFEDEHIPKLARDLEIACNTLIKPKQLLVVASEKGKKVLELADLRCDIVALTPAAKVRKKGIKKETDQDLLELRKQRRKRNPDRDTTPDM